jgi:hypothetical protein
MTIPRHAAIYLVLFLTVSCANFAPRGGQAFRPRHNTAVVYGRFKFMDNIVAHESLFKGYRMALQLSNDESKQPLYVRFSKSQPISWASIPAGHYTLTAFVATDTADRVLTGKQFGPEDKIDVHFAAEPDTAIYLGDYSGFVKFYVFGDLTTFETGLTEATNNFSGTTTDFHQEYPNLVPLPVRSGMESPGK